MYRLKDLAKFLGISVKELRRLFGNRKGKSGSVRWALHRSHRDQRRGYKILTQKEGATENDLYQAWRDAKDPNDQERKVQPLHKAVRSHARAVVYSKLPEAPETLAEEIAGDVILGIKNFRGKSKFSTYVHRVAENKVNEQLRKVIRDKKAID